MVLITRALLIACLFFSFIGKAEVILSGARVTIDSEVLAETREIQVLLPEGYQSERDSTYPVIYLLDGDYNFHGMSGMLDLLANKGELIPKVILVGIADKGTGAYRKNMAPTGQADKFLRFLNDEVKPLIDKQYRTSSNSILVGHSIGGLFVINTLLESPQSFDNYVAISPSAWYENNFIVNQAREKVKSIKQPVSLYISVADEVKMSIYSLVNEFDTHAKKNLDWHFKRYLDENHNSTGLIALRDSLKMMFKGWHLNEKIAESNSPEQTVEYYQGMLTDLDFNQSIPAGIAHIIIRQHYRQDRAKELPAFIEKVINTMPASKSTMLIKQASFAGFYDTKEAALKILLAHEEEFSHSINYQKAIAKTYEQMKNTAQAKLYYQRALKLAKEQKVAQWQFNIINEYL